MQAKTITVSSPLLMGSVGYGLFLAWQSLIVLGEDALEMFEFALPTADQLLFAPANVALLLAVAFYVNHTGRDLWTRTVVMLAFGTMAAIPCVGLAMAQLPPVATVAVKLLRGITEGAAFLIWNAQLVRYRASTAWRMYAWAIVVSSSLSLLGAMGPAPVIVGACTLLPVASGWALLAVRRLHTDEHDYELEEKTGWVLPWRPVLLTALYTFALSTCVHLQDAVCAERLSMMFFGTLGHLLVGALVLAALSARQTRFGTDAFFKLGPILFVGGLWLFGVGGAGLPGIARVLASAGDYCVMLMTVFTLNDICHRYGVRAEWVFGLTQAGYRLMGILGSATGDAIAPYALDNAGVLYGVAGLLAVLLLVGSACFEPSATRAAWGLANTTSHTGAETGEAHPTAHNYLEDHVLRCALVARHYDLTLREEGVLALLAQGLTDRDIEAALNVAHSTLRTHTQHIYAKLNVHSREEAATIVREWRG